MSNFHTISMGNISLTASLNGGCITSLTFGKHHILKPSPTSSIAFPFAGQSAMFPMAPIVNRISNNQFEWQGRRFDLPLNGTDPNFFLHGDAWLSQWHLIPESCCQNQLAITMQSSIPDVCCYKLIQTIRIEHEQIYFTLTLKNNGDTEFPFGIGFHPFFVVDNKTRIQFSAQGFWTEDENHLPAAYSQYIPNEFNFSSATVIPDHWINNGYYSGSGLDCTLTQERIKINIRSAEPYIQVYKPQGDAGFICIEPQSQFVDAHSTNNKQSLTVLKPTQSMSVFMSIRISER
ncbi:hypothetical protein RJ45_21360 [Photobacterium gaetbulicola]|uniref:Aldose epimerase n=1 Tax=Photobacterium gaetbulicola TaxID=1295392 RepID=A0A0B9GSB6_9GAMM|nr:aldose 1-epimerase [Photobacterium gaetbulicola]KHT61666.1 hypothetical protein RJ45_21360 [Photobacterium gaetbulicola]